MPYQPSYPQDLIKHMSQGLSFGSFGGKVDAGIQTLRDWAKKYPEFREAKEIGKQKSMLFFETCLIVKVTGKDTPNLVAQKVEAVPLMFALKTRHRDTYSEKVEIEISPSSRLMGEMSEKQLKRISILANEALKEVENDKAGKGKASRTIDMQESDDDQ